MDAKALTRDLAVLRTVSERFNRIQPQHTALWSHKGTCLAAGTDRYIMMISTDESIPLAKPVPLDRLYSIVRPLSRVILVDRGMAKLSVSGEGHHEDIEYLSCDPLPLPKGAPFEGRSTTVRIPEDSFQFVSEAMRTEKDSTRYALNGVFLDGKNQMMVASDGKRLHFRPLESEKPFQKFTIPEKAAHGLLAAMKMEGLPIRRLRLSGEPKDVPEWMSFLIKRTLLYAKTQDGDFPDWKAVVPDRFLLKLVLDAEQYRSAVKDSIAYLRKCKDKESSCHFSVTGCLADGGSLELVAYSKTHGTRKHRLKVIDSFGEVRAIHMMGFEPSYLMDASWNDRETYIQVKNQENAILVDGCAVVMPKVTPHTAAAARQLVDEMKKAHCSIKAVTPNLTSLWRKKAVAKPQDPAMEEPAPKTVPDLPKLSPHSAPETRPTRSAVSPIVTRKAMPVAAEPDPVQDHRKPPAKAKTKEYDFLLFS